MAGYKPLAELDIKVSAGITQTGRGVLRIEGENARGRKFGKELHMTKDLTLNQLEEFLLEVKYEALNPPHFNIPPDHDNRALR